MDISVYETTRVGLKRERVRSKNKIVFLSRNDTLNTSNATVMSSSVSVSFKKNLGQTFLCNVFLMGLMCVLIELGVYLK